MLAPADGGGDGATAGQPGGGQPDFSTAATTLGVPVEELEAALGQPPFDLAAAAATLGITVDELSAVLPAPPADAPTGRAPAGGAPPADG